MFECVRALCVHINTHTHKCTKVLGGLLTNCCVESTMRTAFEKGFNVVTLKDCTAATSEDGQKGAVDGAPRDSLMRSFTVFNARLSRVWCLSKPRSVRVKHKGPCAACA